jgi:thiamine biosynthesis protein ThiI
VNRGRAQLEQSIIAHYSEIALKGKNRKDFENILIRNIERSLGKNLRKIISIESRLFIYPDDIEKAKSALSNVFGISFFSRAFTLDKDIDKIKNFILEKSGFLKNYSIKIFTSRSDKTFPITSPQISRHVGEVLEEAGFKIDLENPEKKIYIWILKKNAIVAFEKNTGLGGLPVGSSGNVLSLLSGGIDSPVASWLMMRRGCTLDFLHVHASPNNSDVKKSKIPQVIKQLRKFHPTKCRLFIAPYLEFYKKTAKIDPRTELVIFRRFIFRLASRIAAEYGHLGIVSGDNIGQVASQTLENLYSTSAAASIPVYRPLVTYDKQEIINQAKRIRTFDISVEEYKDCCSLVAMKHPSTKVKAEYANKIEDQIEIEKIVEKTMKQIDIIEI